MGKKWKPIAIVTSLLLLLFILLSLYSKSQHLMEQIGGFIGFAFFLFILMHTIRFIRRIWKQRKTVSKDLTQQNITDSQAIQPEGLSDDVLDEESIAQQTQTESDDKTKSWIM